MKKQVIIVCLFLFSLSFIHAQFYKGGNGDGHDVETILNTTLENISLTVLYEGQNGDGHDVESLLNTTLNNISLAILYEGGNGDGHDVEALLNTTLNNISLVILYEGGNGDGHDVESLLNTTLNNISLAILYTGGNDDGHDVGDLLNTTLNNISLAVLYAGGNGDGHDVNALLNTTLNNISIAILYEGGNGDGFDVNQEIVFLNPNAIVDLRLNVAVLLQGPIIDPEDVGLMNDILRDVSMLPTTSPYSDALSVNPSVFNTGGSDGSGLNQNNIVDWIWIEIRSGINNTLVVDGTSALLQRDGDIVDIDGISEVILRGLTGEYYIAIKHRNHLSVMTDNKIPLSVTNTIIDLTNSATDVFGNNARVQLPNGTMAMWAGNTNGDGIVQYSGTNPDTPNILSFILNDPANILNFPTFQSIEYDVNDVNMDGIIQYSGITPDTPFILQNVLAHPGNTLNFSTYQIQEQLPEN